MKSLDHEFPINRPYSRLEALLAVSYDHHHQTRVSLRGYADRWQWHTGRVSRFLEEISCKINYRVPSGQTSHGVIQYTCNVPSHSADRTLNLLLFKDLDDTTKQGNVLLRPVFEVGDTIYFFKSRKHKIPKLRIGTLMEHYPETDGWRIQTARSATRFHGEQLVIPAADIITPGEKARLKALGQHRRVMEDILGRPLEPGEVVHHINGDKTDNNPQNLIVMTAREHAQRHARGVAMTCVVCGKSRYYSPSQLKFLASTEHYQCWNCKHKRKGESDA